MALEAGGHKFCKVTFHENGRKFTRRYHKIIMQASDGRVHEILGDKLPESMDFYSGKALRGAHMAEVLMSPNKIKGTSILSEPSGWICKRDAFYLVLGFFFFQLVTVLAENAAFALM